jgi:hypothetical protein
MSPEIPALIALPPIGLHHVLPNGPLSLAAPQILMLPQPSGRAVKDLPLAADHRCDLLSAPDKSAVADAAARVSTPVCPTLPHALQCRPEPS